MGAKNITRWIGSGLLGLPLYGALTFFSSLNPQPDPNTHYDAWARYVTTDFYVLTHVFGSILGLILAIFGTFALGAYLTRSRAGHLGLAAMVISVLGSALFLPVMGVSTFSAPKQGQAYLAGVEEFVKLPDIFADTVSAVTSLLFVVLIFVGNLLLGVAVWRSGVLPRWAGATWAASAVVFYALGAVLGMATTGGALVTQPLAALLMVLSGGWMALSVLRRPSARTVGVGARPSVQ